MNLQIKITLINGTVGIFDDVKNIGKILCSQSNKEYYQFMAGGRFEEVRCDMVKEIVLS